MHDLKDRPLTTVIYSVHSLSPHPPLINTNVYTVDRLLENASCPPTLKTRGIKRREKVQTRQSKVQSTANGNTRGGVLAFVHPTLLDAYRGDGARGTRLAS